MRVTTGSLIANLLININRNLERVHKNQRKIASGKELMKPSDNPMAVAKSLLFRKTLGDVEQYKQNTAESLEWLKVTESSLSSIIDKLNIARENTVLASNDTYSGNDRTAIGGDIGFIIDELITISNTTYAGRYVFSGSRTSTQPFNDTYDPTGDEIKSTREIGNGINVTVNLAATEIFVLDKTVPYDSGSNSTLRMLSDLQNVLYQESQGSGRPASEEISVFITQIDTAIRNAMDLLSEAGTKIKNLEGLQERHEETIFSFTSLLSGVEDANVTKLVTDLYAAESVYEASLAAGARIIQPSLMDFLR